MTNRLEHRRNGLFTRYPDIVPLFTKADYDLLYKARGGKPHLKPRTKDIRKRLIWLSQPHDPPIHLLKLLDLKDVSYGEFLVIWQHLANRFDDSVVASKKGKSYLPVEPDEFWIRMVKTAKKSKRHVAEEWKNADGTDKMIRYLKSLWETQKGLCAISGENMDLRIGINEAHLNKASLDRIDNSKGYVPENLHLVCWWVNSMKSKYTMKEFLHRVKTIAVHNKMGIKNVTSQR